MIIFFVNIKGGTGKTTLSLALANYLTTEHHIPLLLIDLDHKQSIISVAENAKSLHLNPLYQIKEKSDNFLNQALSFKKQNNDAVVIIDTPNVLDHTDYIHLLNMQNSLVICPFKYDELNFQGPILTATFLQKINPHIKISFIPNRIKSSNSTWGHQEKNELLKKYGEVSSPLADKIHFESINNVHTPANIIEDLFIVFNEIFKNQFNTS